MKANEAIKIFAGAVVVYVVMAACSAGGGPLNFGPRDGSTASILDGPGGGGSGDSDNGSGADTSGPSIIDALSDPVPDVKADVNSSGSRLKAKYYAGTDGSKQLTGAMHDSQLNIDCYFSTAADGTTRCMPSAGLASLYADSNCTQPVVLVACGDALPTYVSATSLGSPNAAPIGIHMFQIGSVTAAATMYQLATSLADGGACPMSTTYACNALNGYAASLRQAGYRLFTVGSEMQPSAFVQATVQTEP